MPSISMFYGIVVYLYYLDNKQHHLPHNGELEFGGGWPVTL